MYIYYYIYIIYTYVYYVHTHINTYIHTYIYYFLQTQFPLSIFRNLILSVPLGLRKIQLFDLTGKLTD